MNIHMATLPRVIQIQIAQPRFSEMSSPREKSEKAKTMKGKSQVQCFNSDHRSRLQPVN